MPGGKSDDLGPDVSLDAELAKQVEVLSSCLPISPALPKRLLDERDQPLQRGGRRIEVPGASVGVLQHDRRAWAREPEVCLHLLVAAPERADLVAGVHEVERVGLELAR